MKEQDTLMTTPQAAHFLGISERWFRVRICKDVPHVRVGLGRGQRLFRLSDLRAFRDARGVTK